MAADDLSPVGLPPVAPAGDAPPRDSRRGRQDKDQNRDSDKKESNGPGPEKAQKSEKPDRRSQNIP